MITRLVANRGSSADAVEELVIVIDDLHTELREQPAVEGAGQIELAHCENDMGHAVDVDHDETPLADGALALTRLTEATMPKAYIMVMYRSSPEPTTFAQYGELAIPAVHAGGGRILARGALQDI